MIMKKFKTSEINLILELLGAFMLAMAFFYRDITSLISGFFGFLIVIDLFNTNIRRLLKVK